MEKNKTKQNITTVWIKIYRIKTFKIRLNQQYSVIYSLKIQFKLAMLTNFTTDVTTPPSFNIYIIKKK